RLAPNQLVQEGVRRECHSRVGRVSWWFHPRAAFPPRPRHDAPRSAGWWRLMRTSTLLARVQRKAVVFVFHDVTDRAWFDDCITEISSTRHVVSLDEVATRRQAGTCALTFDDGRLSVADVVHPVLRAHKLPYTVFVCTDVLMGGPVPWFVRVH